MRAKKVCVWGFAATVVIGTAVAAESQDGKTEVKVYTNRDLPKDGSGVTVRALKPIQHAPAQRSVVAPAPRNLVAVGDAERDVRDVRSQIDELERRLLAIHNPFLPRPILPPDEARAWIGLDGVQRAERVQSQLADARGELSEAMQRQALLQDSLGGEPSGTSAARAARGD